MRTRLAGAVLLAVAAATSSAQDEKPAAPPAETKATPEATAALARMNAAIDRPVDGGLKSMTGDVEVTSSSGPATVHVTFAAPATFTSESTDWLGHGIVRATLKAAMNGVAPIDGVPDVAETAKKDGVELLVFTSSNADGGTSRSEYSLDAAGLPTSAAHVRKRTVNGSEREEKSTARFEWSKAGDRFRLARLEFGDGRTTTTVATIAYQEFGAVAVPTRLTIELVGDERTYDCRFKDLRLDDKKVELRFDDDAWRAAAAEIEAQVLAILEPERDATSEDPRHPKTRQLVALGRPAVAPLLKVVCDDEFSGQGVMRSSAAKALADLVADEDAPLLARRMREGHRELEVAFRRLRSPEALAIYADLVREGCFSSGLGDVVSRHLDDAVVVEACCAWLADPKFDGHVDWAIKLMAETAVAFGARAKPALEALVRRALEDDARHAVAMTLVRVGGKAGIPMLIDGFATTVDRPGALSDGRRRHEAGELLNAVSGTSLYVGGLVRDEQLRTTRWEGNFAEAAKGFREWWERSKDALSFDAVTRKWSVK